MEPSAIHYEPQPASTASPEVFVNQIADQTEWAKVYSLKHEDIDGLDIGTWGGRWSGFSVDEEEYTLTDDADNYLVVLRADGVLSISTAATNWNATSTYARVYKITTLDGAITAIEDHRGGAGGVHGSGGAAGALSTEFRGLTFTSDTDSQADSDPGNGLFKWNNATQGSATVLYFDNQTADAQSLTTLWGNLGIAGFIHLQQSDDATKWQLWRWTAAPVDGTGYRKFTVTLQASGGSIADAKTVYATFTNDRTFIAPRVASTASSTTPTPNADTTDVYILTALTDNATFGAPTGSPVQGQPLIVRIKDDSGGPYTLAWNAIYREVGVTLPTTTVSDKTIYVGLFYNDLDTKWDVVAVREEA
jgi:hypothetical protein